MERVLAERTYGDDRSPLVSVNQPNSLVSRLVKLLEYLDAEQPERGWRQYLDGGAPDWGRIVLSGHSQGSAVTALLARDHELMRAIMTRWPLRNRRLHSYSRIPHGAEGHADRAPLRVSPRR